MKTSLPKDPPSGRAEENGAGADRPRSHPSAPAPDPPPPAELVIKAARVAVGYEWIAGGYFLSEDALAADVTLSPGLDLRRALHEAVDAALQRLEEMRSEAAL